MITRLSAAGLVALTLSAASVAAPIRFDFGDGTVDAGTGVAANVVIAEGTSLAGNQTATVDGTTITLQGVGPAGRVWGSNSQGIGIIPGDMLGMAGQRRIDGTADEYVHFSFDKDATLDSIRLGALNANEQVTIAFVSGTDPFGGGSFTLSYPSSPPGPQDDIPVDVFVTAGTVLSLTATTPVQSGVLWNDIVVTPIPEPATAAMLTFSAVLGIAFRRRRSDPCCI
jgi:hypothetical protein